MVIKDSITVSAPIEHVWAFLHDIPRVAACVPGAQDVQEIGPEVYQGRLTTRVGAVSVVFSGQARIVERAEPGRRVAVGEGKDQTSGSLAKASFTGTLTPDGDGTRLTYEVDLALYGRLAQFGSAVIQGTAKKMAAEFAKRMHQALSEQP
jgi:carbon monoxide dehydrogenase subunit G